MWTLDQEEELSRDAAAAAEIKFEEERRGREGDGHADQGASMDVISLSSDDEDEVVEVVPPLPGQRPRWPAGALNPAAPPVAADLDAPGAMMSTTPSRTKGRERMKGESLIKANPL